MNKYLVTGGCGFIGTNLVDRLLVRGEQVVVFDNLSRHGAQVNAKWLSEKYGDKFRLVVGDVRDYDSLARTLGDANVIVHLAAQVTVTTSVTNPREDFEINALGTFNTLEAARLSGNRPVFIYASTNKVYGEMESLRIEERPTRYAYVDIRGYGEDQPLDFHSPYGCSKGTGDQYVHDYHRIYGLPTVVFRQSTIYGPRQFGIEDQGWMAWFMIAAVLGKPITIYGNGKQVRDMLYVSDLLDAYDAALARIDRVAGQVFNIGGGPDNTISIWSEFGPELERRLGRTIPVTYSDWRPGDQKVVIYSRSRAENELDWKPQVGLQDGIERLYRWISNNKGLFS